MAGLIPLRLLARQAAACGACDSACSGSTKVRTVKRMWPESGRRLSVWYSVLSHLQGEIWKDRRKDGWLPRELCRAAFLSGCMLTRLRAGVDD